MRNARRWDGQRVMEDEEGWLGSTDLAARDCSTISSALSWTLACLLANDHVANAGRTADLSPDAEQVKRASCKSPNPACQPKTECTFLFSQTNICPEFKILTNGFELISIFLNLEYRLYEMFHS